LRRFHYSMGTRRVKEWVLRRAPHFGKKIAWFLNHGYEPHIYQLAFHTLCNDVTGKILEHRFLVAGRRGGKTLSAAWDVAYYALNPEDFHWDVHKKKDDRPLHIWVLVPNFSSAGRAAKRTLLGVLKQCGLERNKDFNYNQGENWIEFPNGTLVEFKTAEQADSLVGAGIDILWIDEAAVIPTKDAYEYATPALDDHLGVVIGTTTPRGKNWFYDLGWSPDAHEDETIGTVEYTSIHNPFFSKERWLYRKKRYHPLKFKQEYMAAFDSMAGKDLHGDWLHTYDLTELPLKEERLGVQLPDGKLRIANLDLDIFIGVDPAISLSDEADSFAYAVLGVTKDKAQAYLLDVWKGRIDFPDQIQLLQELHLKWRPIFIGIEQVAYQAALVQMAKRLSTMPNISGQHAPGKKNERIMSMSPSFKIAQVKVRGEFKDFIDEWLDFDSSRKNQKDDTLDAVEIALRTAGFILPGFPDESDTETAKTIEEMAWARQPKPYNPMDEDWDAAGGSGSGYDEHLGDMS
jgi:predicted phage terminase large subunit-like protein